MKILNLIEANRTGLCIDPELRQEVVRRDNLIGWAEAVVSPGWEERVNGCMRDTEKKLCKEVAREIAVNRVGDE